MKKYKYSFLFFYIIGLLLSYTNAYSQKKNDSARYYYDKIIYPKQNSDLLDGYNYYHQKKIEALENQDTVRSISYIRLIALSQLKMGLSHETELSAIEAIKLIDQAKGKDTLIQAKYGLLIDLGIAFRNADNYHKAIEVYQEALKIANKQKDSITIINNIGNIYYDLEDYKTAIEHFNSIYDKVIKNGQPLQKARVLNNLGAVQSKLDLPDALENLNTSLTIRKKEQSTIGTYLTYKNLFHYYNDRNEKNKATLYADSAYRVIIKTNNKPFIKDALALHTLLSKDPKVLEYQRLTDSIFKAEQISDNEYSFNKYRYDKQEKIALQNQLQKEKEKRLKLIYQGIAGLIFILLIVVYFVFKAKNKREKLEQIYLTETRISKKIHDEVANDVYQVMTQLQNEKNTNERVLDDLENIYSKTRDISKENSAIDVQEKFDVLLKDLLLSYKTKEVTVLTKNNSSIDWTSISTLNKTTIYRVLQELMTNMRKHSKATIVVITFQQNHTNLTINYTDNGIGTDLKKQVGLQNVENRIKAMKGSIIFETEINKGFKVKMTV